MRDKSPEDFNEAVFDLVRLVPSGRVTTYGAIARCIGASGASRRVGWALNQSFAELPAVPAHRVVNRFGQLTGARFFPEERTMANLLAEEGVRVVDNQIEGFEGVFWDPWEAEELKENLEF